MHQMNLCQISSDSFWNPFFKVTIETVCIWQLCKTTRRWCALSWLARCVEVFSLGRVWTFLSSSVFYSSHSSALFNVNKWVQHHECLWDWRPVLLPHIFKSSCRVCRNKQTLRSSYEFMLYGSPFECGPTFESKDFLPYKLFQAHWGLNDLSLTLM